MRGVSNKIKAISLLTLSLFVLSNCNFWDRSLQEVMTDPFERLSGSQYEEKKVEMTPLQMPYSIIVCRAKQCAPVKLSMSKEYIYNSLVQMMENNNHQKALACAADAGSHNCYQNYVSLPITVGITPAYMYIDSVKISDVQVSKKNQSVQMMLNYNVTYNGQYPDCAPSKTLLYVKNTENIILKDDGYRCKMTTIGTSTIKTLFLIDYIDLDYGFIGGSYSIGLSGPAYGGGSGYMLLRLNKNGSYPNNKPTTNAEGTENSVKKSESKSSLTAEYLANPVTGATQRTKSEEVNGVQVFPVK
jgi:hypothetical protein